MSVEFRTPPVQLVIETDQYAGNFERELCAFATGTIGDCGVGEDEAQEFAEAFPDDPTMFEEWIVQWPDDSGCFRPVSIINYPVKTEYNSLAIFLDKELPYELIITIKNRAIEYCKQNSIEIVDFHLIVHEPLKFGAVKI